MRRTAAKTNSASPQRSAPSARPSPPKDTLDAQQVASMRAALGDEADAIIGLFLREAADRLVRMKSLTGKDQRRALNREAHSLKSAAATFGCATLAQLSRALEDEADTIDAERLPARLAALSEAYAAAKAALTRA